MRNKFLVLVFLLFEFSCNAQDSVVDFNDEEFILDKYGIFINYDELEKSKYTDENIITGSLQQYEGELIIIENRDRIPIIIGLDFGIKFSAPEFQNVTNEKVKIVIKHPRIVNPETNKESVVDSFDMLLHGIHGNQVGWFIEKDYEVVKGEWIFEVIYNKKIVLSKVILTY